MLQIEDDWNVCIIFVEILSFFSTSFLIELNLVRVMKNNVYILKKNFCIDLYNSYATRYYLHKSIAYIYSFANSCIVYDVLTHWLLYFIF